ncbi:ATP-binding protein [Candidatus Poriferisocius sp.]|uniref:ATP-binding protein n=1 Tax=Candidatus Poriferisocius sp. TaxID=3101276 RepID=UPI003B024A0C
MSPALNPERATDADLAAEIEGSTDESPVSTVLRTDERVLARVTDGIYRQPGSAIRELVSNAYDADARQVVIKTDRPRFQTITVEDDGIGMTPAALAHLLHHIGGSAKRTHEGAELGVTDHADLACSPSGRRLIGKIGIGLFSVAQLTYRFQIITKTASDPWRTVASVVLRRYSDEGAPQTDEHGEYEAGRVTIWREPAADVESHGTTIILTDIRHQTRGTLQSRDIWAAIDSDRALAPEESRDLEPPAFHIGRVRPDDADALQGEGGAYDCLPWSRDDGPDDAFGKLVKAVWQQVDQGIPNPQLERIFDYYLRMVWQLSLAIPAPYVFGNPFELPLQDQLSLFELPKAVKEAPVEFTLADKETVASAKSIGSSVEIGGDFHVLVDDLQLARPLIFTDLPETSHAVKKPILAIGQVREEFDGVLEEFSGGPLEFEVYLMWAPKIAPTEHQGVLVRVHGSSGTLFDPTFMRYQISEQTRLRQITCEIFVSEGFEAALNIDRESFNYAHPHVIYITKWLHTALRRVATIQKRIAADIRQAVRETAAAGQEDALRDVAVRAWREESDDLGAEPPPVEFDDMEDKLIPAQPGAYRFRRKPVFGESERRKTRQDNSTEQKIRAIVQLLAAYGILERLTDQQQERLLAGILEILEASAQ